MKNKKVTIVFDVKYYGPDLEEFLRQEMGLGEECQISIEDVPVGDTTKSPPSD